MTHDARVDKLLGYAMEKESQAAQFYLDLAKRVEKPVMRLIFEQFAREEEAHKGKLARVAQGEIRLPAPDEPIESLGIAEKLPPVVPTDAITYADALILAMRREREAYAFYTELAERAHGAEFRAMVRSLAAEEARHKLVLELEYEHLLFTGNASWR